MWLCLRGITGMNSSVGDPRCGLAGSEFLSGGCG